MFRDIGKVFQSQAMLERKIAALRCIEAIRLYAAAHGGKLPATLGEIKEVPIPVDPITGKAFEYEAHGDKAKLAAPNFAKGSSLLTYEINLQP